MIEGVDGAGKTTLIEMLAQTVTASGHKVAVTAEPTVSTVGGLLRDALKGKVLLSPYELATLFLADRIAHNLDVNTGIKSLLAKGYTIICDRYYYSTFAYQGLAVDIEWLIAANKDCPAITTPDICIFLDIDPRVARQRIADTRCSMDIYERDLEQAEKIRQNFHTAFALLDDNVVTIDAQQTSEAMVKEIMGKLEMGGK